jgi:CheY-like chemotaxis protein
MEQTPTIMKTVLLVDDDHPFREMMGHALSLAGFCVRSAGTGSDALQILRDEPVDAVILDIIMPEMDGIEVLRLMRKQRASLPVVVMSGGGRLTAKCYLPMAQRLGATAVLEKPFRPADLVQMLKKLLNLEATEAPASAG